MSMYESHISRSRTNSTLRKTPQLHQESFKTLNTFYEFWKVPAPPETISAQNMDTLVFPEHIVTILDSESATRAKCASLT